MVVHRIPQLNTNVIKSNEVCLDIKKMETTIFDNPTEEVPMVPRKNPFNMRPLTLAALKSTSKVSPLSRMRSRNFTSAAKSLDILRQNLQAAINKEIDLVIRKYLEKFFEPAVRNIKDNLGQRSVTEGMIKEVCIAMLEEAKQMYCISVTVTKTTPKPTPKVTPKITPKIPPKIPPKTPPKIPPKIPQKVTPPTTPQASPSRKRKISEISVQPPKKKEDYDQLVKWDPTRVHKDTLFILSTCANRACGLGAIRGKLSTKHPELVKYTVDADDREWLSTARAPGLIPGTPNISLMFIEDIIQLLHTEEYRTNPNVCYSELKGFGVPDFIQRKIRAYMTLMRTKYLPPVPMDFVKQKSTYVKPTPKPKPKPKPKPIYEPVLTDNVTPINTYVQPTPTMSPKPNYEPVTMDFFNDIDTFIEPELEPKPNYEPELEPKPNYEPIQLSVGVEVESLSSTLAPLSLFESGLIELDSQFLSLAGLDDISDIL